MALLISEFEGLGDADFDVYRQACWSSNLHNLDRMRTKARVKALLERVHGVVGDADLVIGTSSEVPSVWNGRTVKDQWAYLVRTEAARKALQPVMARSTDLATQVKDPAEHHQHVVLALRLDHEALEVGLRLHAHAAVDLANLEGHAQAAPDELAAAVASLAELTLEDGRPVSAGNLLADVRTIRQGGGTSADDGPWVVVRRRLPRAAVVAARAGIADAVVATFEALLPLFRFAAWTPANDHVGVQAQAAALAEAVEQRREEAEAELKAAEAEREARQREARERAEAELADQRAWKAGLRARREEQKAAEAERESADRARREAADAERAARQAEREAAHAAEQAERAAELAERVARARRDAQEAVKAAEARKQAQAQRPAARSAARPDGPRPDGPRPGAARPEGGRPEGGRPGAGRPEGTRPEGSRPEGSRPERKERPAEARPEATEAQRPPRADDRRPLAVGDRCRLERGLLAGKEGVVRSVDEKKGYYQVRVGVLDVNISFADAVAVS